MAEIIGMEEANYVRLERGTHMMERVHQENFISRFGSDIYAYVHGERDQVEFGGKLLRREAAMGDGFEGITEPDFDLNFDRQELDGLEVRFREASEKERDKIYKKLVLAYKSLQAENIKLRNENSALRKTIVEAKEMMINKFLKKKKK